MIGTDPLAKLVPTRLLPDVVDSVQPDGRAPLSALAVVADGWEVEDRAQVGRLGSGWK